MSFASYFVSNILVKRGKPRTALHHYDYLNVVLERAMLRAVLWLGGLLWAPGLEMRAADGDAAPSTLSCSPTLCSKTNPRSQNWYLKDAFPAPFWRCFRWTFQSLFLFWDEETCPPQQSLTSSPSYSSSVRLQSDPKQQWPWAYCTWLISWIFLQSLNNACRSSHS